MLFLTYCMEISIEFTPVSRWFKLSLKLELGGDKPGAGSGSAYTRPEVRLVLWLLHLEHRCLWSCAVPHVHYNSSITFPM